jgi:hypothetical protein
MAATESKGSLVRLLFTSWPLGSGFAADLSLHRGATDTLPCPLDGLPHRDLGLRMGSRAIMGLAADTVTVAVDADWSLVIWECC